MLADWNIDTQRLWEQVRFQPLAYRNDTWYGSTYWSGPDWTRVGKDWHHSGEQTASIRRFDVPRDGRLQVTGRVYKADPNGGDGVHLEIRLGRNVVWQADLDAADQSGVEPAQTLDVHKGDAVRFVVHRRGTIGFDTTHWDPCLTYADGEAFQASAAFSAQQQGAGQWFYEMETDASRQALLAWPTIHGLRPEFSLVHQNLASPEPQQITVDDAFPAWVLAGGMDDSGLAVCLPAPCTLQYETTSEGLLNVRLLYALPADAAELRRANRSTCPPVSWLPIAVPGCKAYTHSSNCSPPKNRCRNLPACAGNWSRPLGDIGAMSPSQSSFELELCVQVQQDWAKQDGNLDDAVALRAHPDSTWNAPARCWTTCGTHIPRRLSLRRRPSGCHNWPRRPNSQSTALPRGACSTSKCAG